MTNSISKSEAMILSQKRVAGALREGDKLLPQVEEHCSFGLFLIKPRIIHRIAKQRSMICHYREHLFTALESRGAMLTPLHPVLCIALGDVRLKCSFLAMETHSMKPSMHCSWADLKAGALKELTVQKVGNLCALCTSASAHTVLWT